MLISCSSPRSTWNAVQVQRHRSWSSGYHVTQHLRSMPMASHWNIPGRRPDVKRKLCNTGGARPEYQRSARQPKPDPGKRRSPDAIHLPPACNTRTVWEADPKPGEKHQLWRGIPVPLADSRQETSLAVLIETLKVSVSPTSVNRFVKSILLCARCQLHTPS